MQRSDGNAFGYLRDDRRLRLVWISDERKCVGLSSDVATSLLYFLMLLFSGATIPYELFPEKMQLVAGCMPLGIGIRLMKAASVGTSLCTMGKEIALLAVIVVVCIAVSIKTFRCE